MTPTHFAALMRSATVCILLLLVFSQQHAFSKPVRKSKNVSPQPPLVIRVGAIYYDDSDEDYKKIQAILSALEERSENSPKEFRRPVSFNLAVGTYDEIMNWFESDQLDLAIMNPGPLGVLIGNYDRKELENIFVGIRGVIPRMTSLASKDERGQNVTAPRSMYQSVMVLNREALKEFPAGTTPTEAELFDLVMRKAGQKKVHFFFVQPLSTSGYIYPRQVLGETIKLESTDYELTYSHDVSITNISQSGYDENGRLKVAFVSDETSNTLNNKNLLTIRSGKMSTKIVQDAMLLTPDFIQREPEVAASLKKLLLAGRGPQTFNLTAPNETLFQQYDQIGQWIKNLGGYRALLSDKLTIDQIITRINNFNGHHKDPDERARVALVLSGGGAKCAYQLGAVEAIEDKLAAAHANSSQELGIDMVIGTSGGAINALIIAAEVTKDPNKRDKLASTWQSFSQSEILKPSNFVRRLLGLALGLILSLFVLSAVYTYRFLRWMWSQYVKEKPAGERSNRVVLLWRKVSTPFDRLTWPERVGSILLVLALVFYVFGRIPISLPSREPADWLLQHHVLVHITEYGRQTLRWAALALCIFGVCLLIDSFLSIRKQNARSRAFRPIVLMVAMLLSVILPVFTLYRILLSQDEKSLFVSEGIVAQMSSEMPRLLGIHTSSDSLPEISKDIIDNEVIKRDLVITGSILQNPRESASAQTDDVPPSSNDDSDLYFIYKAGSNPELPQKVLKDKRFVSLRDNVSILLDAVIGSGAIFPAFEPRPLAPLKRVDKSISSDVSIIDGGFVHNSPIEAAVKLNATHIIVIEASPENRPKHEVNLLNNSVAAFNHLFTQAQLLDARSRREAEVYTLQPLSPTADGTPFLCTLDFGENFIRQAMKWGDTDARDSQHPRFVRQPRPSGLGDAHR